MEPDGRNGGDHPAPRHGAPDAGVNLSLHPELDGVGEDLLRHALEPAEEDLEPEKLLLHGTQDLELRASRPEVIDFRLL